MVMYNVYTSNIKRKYRAHFCSFATLFLICTLGLTVICPVLVAYHSNGKNNFQILTLLDDNVEGTFLEVGRSFQLLKFHYFPGYEFWVNAQFSQSFGCLARFQEVFAPGKQVKLRYFMQNGGNVCKWKSFIDVFLSVILFMSPIPVLVLIL